ncbi:uncharacterized protein KY384_001855 [Bacidia gigantensis]|uniref:uncharacterized protein n=1 Tax=Bacidia gigantensis TaxID=2732470 RepID=UPI001D04BB9F|nr:uncharacterized protein KY384_001855 [Bacidia gigantensis]KAG8533072.1 hypothetical protein KY384_001855 [Bacidia gigantensis]
MQQGGKSGPRTRTGCLTCRRRRVKCDEAKPVCNRCQTANLVCDGYREKRRVVSPGPSSAAPFPSVALTQAAYVTTSAAPRIFSYEGVPGVPATPSVFPHTSNRADHLCAYHQFVTSTVYQLFRKDQLYFWRDRIARMSWHIDLVYESIQAIGAIHLAHSIPHSGIMQAEVQRLKVIGLRAYNNAVHQLTIELNGHYEGREEILMVTLLLLNIFECCMGNARLAFQHLWAAVQLLGASSATAKDPHLLPLRETIMRLDFVAQNIVPYARSSFFRTFSFRPALMETPFYSNTNLEIEGLGTILGPDLMMNQRLSLWRLIAAHNHMDKIVWSSFYGANEQPGRDQLLSFRDELLLWRQGATETFVGYTDTIPLPIDDANSVFVTTAILDSLPIPPEPLILPTPVVAITIAYYNLYRACTLAMLAANETVASVRDALEFETFILTYDNLRLTAGLLEAPCSHWNTLDPVSKGGATFCTKLDPSISIPLFLGGRRSFNALWLEYSIATLHSIGRAGLCDGQALANCLKIMRSLDAQSPVPGFDGPMQNVPLSPLGFLSERTIPLLMPNLVDDEMAEAYYLRHGRNFSGVVAKARWQKVEEGTPDGLRVEKYDERGGNEGDVLREWKRSLEAGWHTYVHAGQGRFGLEG